MEGCGTLRSGTHTVSASRHSAVTHIRVHTRAGLWHSVVRHTCSAVALCSFAHTCTHTCRAVGGSVGSMSVEGGGVHAQGVSGSREMAEPHPDLSSEVKVSPVRQGKSLQLCARGSSCYTQPSCKVGAESRTRMETGRKG